MRTALAFALVTTALAASFSPLPGKGGSYGVGTSEMSNALASNIHDIEKQGDAYKWVKCYNMGKLYIPGTAKIEMCDGGHAFDQSKSVIPPLDFANKVAAKYTDVVVEKSSMGYPKIYAPECVPNVTTCVDTALIWVSKALPQLLQPGYVPVEDDRYEPIKTLQQWGKPVLKSREEGYYLSDKQIQAIENRLMEKTKLPWCAEVKGECGRETDEGLALGFYSAQRGCEAYCAGNDEIEWRYGSSFDSARTTNVEYLVGGMPNAPADDKMHQCTCIAKYHEPHSSRTVVEFHDRFFNADYYAVPIREFTEMKDMRSFQDSGNQLYGALHPTDAASMYLS